MCLFAFICLFRKLLSSKALFQSDYLTLLKLTSFQERRVGADITFIYLVRKPLLNKYYKKSSIQDYVISASKVYFLSSRS